MSGIPLSEKLLRVVVTIDSKVTGFELLAPGGVSRENPRVGRCDFLLNPAGPVDADFWIVFANARPTDKMRCAPENTLFIAAEPEEKKVYPKRFYAQFHRIVDTHRRSGHPRVTLHAPCLSWQFGYNQTLTKFEMGYGELIGMRPQETVRNKVSVVCSDAAFTLGQRERLLFLARLKERLGENLDHFGRGFEPIDDKRDAIQGYRFHLAMENCRAPHYWTEKIIDSYLGWAFPLYIGCPNLDEYFPEDSFLGLDIKSPDGAADRILAMLAKPRDEAETAAVAKGRELVLNKHNPWVMWAKWAEEFHDPRAKSADLVIRSHKAYRPFPRGQMYRLKIAINTKAGKPCPKWIRRENSKQFSRHTEPQPPMERMNPLSRLARSLRKRIKPTEREIAIKRWRKDDADNRLRYDCPLGAESVVFDMGGYEGSWAAEIFARYACRVEIFEPVPSFADQISKRFARNKALRVHICGLGASTRTEHLSLSSDASSVFIKATGATVSIKIVDAKEWFERHPVPRVDFMKINIEGGEYELLERLIETGLISRVVHLHIQFHDLWPDSEARMNAIREKLGATHAALFHYKFVWDGWRLKDASN